MNCIEIHDVRPIPKEGRHPRSNIEAVKWWCHVLINIACQVTRCAGCEDVHTKILQVLQAIEILTLQLAFMIAISVMTSFHVMPMALGLLNRIYCSALQPVMYAHRADTPVGHEPEIGENLQNLMIARPFRDENRTCSCRQ